jgi:hypothetical protein
MEKQLAQLKSKYLKGESKLQRGPDGLRQGFEKVADENGGVAIPSARMLRAEKALQVLEAQDNLKSRSIARLRKVIAEEQAEEQAGSARGRLRGLEEKIQALEGQINPDKNIIAQLKQAAAKERVLADKERVASEARERRGSKSADESVSTIRTERETQQAERQKEDQASREAKQPQDQLDLFKSGSLKPTATKRATPANFMRLLRSFNVYAKQDRLAEREKKAAAKNKSAKVEENKVRARVEAPREFAQEIEAQKRAVLETQSIHEEFKNLTQAFKNLKAEAAKYESLAALRQQEVEATRNATQGRVSRTSRDARGADARVREAKRKIGEIRKTIKEAETVFAALKD